MGTVSARITGNFRGKVGNVIYGRWKKLHIAKATYRRKKRKKDILALPQVLKVSLVSSFLKHFKICINTGFNKITNKSTAWTHALSYNLQNGVIGDYPDYKINYGKIKISDGNLEGAWAAKMHIEPELNVRITWQMSAMSMNTITAQDRVYIALYFEDDDSPPYEGRIVGNRDALTYTFKLRRNVAGLVCHVWIFFISPNGKQVSNSDYVGSGILIA